MSEFAGMLLFGLGQTVVFFLLGGFLTWIERRKIKGIRLAHGLGDEVHIVEHRDGRYYTVDGDAIRWLTKGPR